MAEKAEKYICQDCALRDIKPEDLGDHDRCEHWRPEYWEAKGYKRNLDMIGKLGPDAEVLCKKEENVDGGTKKVIHILLFPQSLNKPVEIMSERSLFGVISYIVF